MNKSTKGAIAAGAAAVLLLGGAGSLAYWNADGNLAGGSITAGELKLTAANTGSWTLNGSAVTDIAAVRVVPGDELVYTGTWTIVATGDNLQADLTTTAPTASGGLASSITTDATFEVDDASVTTITDDNDGDLVSATIEVDFPFGSAADNGSQGQTLNLTSAGVVLTQTDATP